MVQVQQLPYIQPSKGGTTTPRKPRAKRKARITRPYIKHLEAKAALIALCRANGFESCSASLPVWEIRKYLKSKGVKPV
jgi:hypothetical protein